MSKGKQTELVNGMKDIENRIEVILDMWETHTLKEIGEKFGISKQRVAQIIDQLRKHGLAIPRKRISSIDWKVLVKKFEHKYGK